MRKAGKIIAGVLALAAAAAVGAGVFFYGTFFQKAGQTIEVLRDLTDGTSFQIDANSKVTFEANSTDAMLLTALLKKATNSDEMSAELSASGQSTGTDFQFDIAAGTSATGEKKLDITDLVKAGNSCYIGVDKLVSALAGDALDSNFLLKVAYTGWIKDHYVSWDQLKQLIFDLTGKTIETEDFSVTWADVFLFLCSPDHLFDPDLWSAVQVSKRSDGYSTYQINADYFSSLIGLDSDQIAAQLEFHVDKEEKTYELKLDMTITDDLGNQIQTVTQASAQSLEEQTVITAPKLLLTDDQINQMKDIIKNVLGGL